MTNLSGFRQLVLVIHNQQGNVVENLAELGLRFSKLSFRGRLISELQPGDQGAQLSTDSRQSACNIALYLKFPTIKLLQHTLRASLLEVTMNGVGDGWDGRQCRHIEVRSRELGQEKRLEWRKVDNTQLRIQDLDK